LNSSPVEVLDRAVPANLIKLELENGQSITYTDQPAVDTFGSNEQTWAIPHNDRDTVYYFATQPTIQTLKLRVSQLIDVHVGDAVQLDLTHPAIYDWSSGTAGYTGAAVVLGRSLDLRTKAVELVVAASAQLSGRALAPSAEVTAYSAGVSVTVARGWYQHFATTLAKDGAFDVGSRFKPTWAHPRSPWAASIRHGSRCVTMATRPPTSRASHSLTREASGYDDSKPQRGYCA
jgi:hypothetical protein